MNRGDYWLGLMVVGKRFRIMPGCHGKIHKYCDIGMEACRVSVCEGCLVGLEVGMMPVLTLR